MNYFKNSELTSTYHIALNTVLNWVKAAQSGRLGLDLVTKNNRSYIADTAHNLELLEQLVRDRKKYRNTRTRRTISPGPEFYKIYNEEQILDIIASLDIHREIPRAYNYFSNGAHYWDKYVNRQYTEAGPNMLTGTMQLLELNWSYIQNLTKGHQRINIVDIGVGNALPAKNMVQHLLDEGVMGKYIALDISPEMLKIAEANLREWFGERLEVECHIADITRNRFDYLLSKERLLSSDDNALNLVFFFGGTVSNVRSQDDAFRTINRSMGRDDLLFFAYKLDSTKSRRFFDFNALPSGDTSLPLNHRLMFDLFNFDPDLYEVEMGYDSEKNQRYIRVRLKVSVELVFEFEHGKRVVNIEKGETILLLRVWQQNALGVDNLHRRNDFYPLMSSQTSDTDYILVVSRIAPEYES